MTDERFDRAAVFVHPTADVSVDAVIGAGTRIWHHAHIREGARIGRDCVIGKGVYVDRDVIIGDGVKIQNGVSVYRGVTLEDHVFVGPNASFTNDLYPRALGDPWTVVPTLLGRGCSVGANATVMCGITLGEYSMISAGAVMTVNAVPYGLYVGNPARLKAFVSRKGLEMTLLEAQGGELLFVCEKTGERLRVTFEALE